jgi:hypothetical protein
MARPNQYSSEKRRKELEKKRKKEEKLQRRAELKNHPPGAETDAGSSDSGPESEAGDATSQES